MNEHDETHVTAPSVWPAALALGITLLLFSIVSTPAVAVAGAVLIVWALAGWIGALRHG